MLKYIYHKASRVIPIDITRILLWDLKTRKASITLVQKKDQNIELLILDAELLSKYMSNPVYELSEDTVRSVDKSTVLCFGVIVDNILAGYMFFCISPVPPERNSGGSLYSGVGLIFPEQVRYLYKVLVLPEFRGHQLAKKMMLFAADHYQSNSVDYIVTTTEWTNTAFLRVLNQVGFVNLTMAGEIVLLGKSRFWLPKDIVIDDGSMQRVRLIAPG